MTGLPEGWAAATLEDVAIWGSGGTPNRNRADYFGGSIPWIKTGELGEKYVHSSEETLTDLGLASSSAKVFPRGSVAIAMYGATIGKLSIWGIDAATNQACAVAQPKLEAISTLFLYYFLQSEKRDLVAAGKGGAQPNISQGLIREWSLPLPPLPEQHRIVAKIEELFSELDAGTASLTRARAQLKIYRQALLKAAFEGKLTAPWRAANPDKLESPETLLSRIRKERDTRFAAALDDWQAALSEWRAGGEVGRKPGKPSRPDPLSELATGNAELDGWPIFELRDLISVSSGQGLTSSEMNGGRHPVYGGNGITGFHDQWFLKEPNLIIGRVGAKCGVTHITQEFAWVTDNALIVTPLVDSFDQRFFLYRLEYMNLNALGSSTGQPVISGSKIYGQEIALPTLNEQSAVADIIEALDSGCAKLSDEITSALTRITALRQSILKKAFSGQLVAQDPADEPASALLARLAQAPAPKPRRKTKP